jgi:hypothetical protein
MMATPSATMKAAFAARRLCLRITRCLLSGGVGCGPVAPDPNDV